MKNPTGAEKIDAIGTSERGADVFARASRHSRRVSFLKRALPLAAVVITAGFAGYTFLVSGLGPEVDLATASIENGALVMSSPQLNGFTSDNRPYKMTADRAKQVIGGGNVIELEGIRAHIPVDEGDFASISAPSGVFDRDRNKLEITSTISLKTSSGMKANLQSARIDIETSSLDTDDPVEIEMDGTQITADSLTASDGGKLLVFEKRVRVRINPDQLRRDGN